MIPDLIDAARAAWAATRRAPLTAGYLVALWITGLVTGSLRQGPAGLLASHVKAGVPSLAHGYWWTPLSSAFWSSGSSGYLIATALAVTILAAAERKMGSFRAAGTMLACQAAGMLAAIGVIKAAALVTEPWLGGLAGETMCGPLPGLIGTGFALSSTLTVLWRRRLRLLLTVAVTISALYVGHLGQVAQACAAFAGLVAGVVLRGRTRPWAGLRDSPHEVRTLVGMLVALSAVGGLLTALVSKPEGPMALFSFVFASPAPDPKDIAEACLHGHLPDICRGLLEQRLYAKWPGVLVQAGPALVLLLSADGLRRGRRLAWWLATLINVTVLGVSIWVTYTFAADAWRQLGGVADKIRVFTFAAEGMLIPVVTLIVLLATRRRFDQTADRSAVRRLTVTLAAAMGLACGLFLVLGYLLRDHFSPRPGFTGLLQDLPLRFISGRLFSTWFLPADLAGRLVYEWVFLGFWLAVFVALTAFFLHTSTYRQAGDAERARKLLMRGGSTLSYMTTWPGNQYWFSSDGQAAVAYRAIAGVAVTLGGPYGDPAAIDGAITEFAAFCEHRGLTPCLYGVNPRARAVTERLGWKSVQVAEDTLLPLVNLEFRGKKWQDVRTALNKAAKEDITAQWWSFPEAPLSIVGQVHRISAKWMAGKGLPEMGFTLGGLDALNDPSVRCLIAVDKARNVHGVTSWLPVYAGGEVVGWTLDFMRRNTDPGTFRGVMEFLIASALLTFQQEGARFASLSGAPLARRDRGEPPAGPQRMLDCIGKVMEPVYGFQSLLHFKAKFQPDYQPLYLAYPDPAALCSIATAIGRAYLPHLTSRQALRMLARLRQES